jgi:hypothetical protein
MGGVKSVYSSNRNRTELSALSSIFQAMQLSFPITDFTYSSNNRLTCAEYFKVKIQVKKHKILKMSLLIY